MIVEPSRRVLRVLIVDDEPVARRGVAQQLEHDEEFQIIGECASGEDMIAAVAREQPDLVFLDVQMPGLDAFAALERLDPGPVPLVIFVTGYDRYAVRAFEAHAIDYLLKPYTAERFRRSCEHAKHHIRQRRRSEDRDYHQRLVDLLEDFAARAGGDAARRTAGAEPPPFLVKRARGHVVVVPEDAVLWIEARGDYVRLHTAKACHLMRQTLGHVERQLDATGFVRIHRSTVVRIAAIAQIRTTEDGKAEVMLTDGTRHAVSTGGRRQLQERLGFTT
jgi:two-component system, LytTR family, response regulator